MRDRVKTVASILLVFLCVAHITCMLFPPLQFRVFEAYLFITIGMFPLVIAANLAAEPAMIERGRSVKRYWRNEGIFLPILFLLATALFLLLVPGIRHTPVWLVLAGAYGGVAALLAAYLHRTAPVSSSTTPC